MGAVAGWATVVGVGIALVVAISDSRQRRREQVRSDETRRRAQARRVFLSSPGRPFGLLANGGSNDLVAWAPFSVELTNRSEEVILDAIVSTTVIWLADYELVSDSKETWHAESVLVDPGDSVSLSDQVRARRTEAGVPEHRLEATAEFTDAAGVRWRIDERRHLIELPIARPSRLTRAWSEFRRA